MTHTQANTQLALAAPSLFPPRGGLFEAVNAGLHRRQPEWDFQKTLRSFWQTQARNEVDFGADPLVVPYLSHFCTLLNFFPSSVSTYFLRQVVDIDFAEDETNKLSMLLRFCTNLLDRLQQERASEPDEAPRLTTNLEVRNWLNGAIQRMEDHFSQERLDAHLKTPLEVWRSNNMRLYAAAAAIPHFTSCCQLVFNQYTTNVHKSLIDASATVDTDQIRKVESAPGLNLTPGVTLNFRIEVMAVAAAYKVQVQSDVREIPYNVTPILQYAVEHYVLGEHPKASLSGRSPEDNIKVKSWVSQLVSEFGFDHYSARQLVSQVHGVTFSRS